MGWLVNIIPVPYPGLEDAPESYKAAWRKYVDPGLTVTPGADREDWLEQAARLEAAMRLLDDPLLRVYGRGIVDRDGKPVENPVIAGRAYYGEVLNADIRRPADYPLETGNAHRYADSLAVRALMRRETLLTPVNAGKVEQAVRAIASHGCGVVVNTCSGRRRSRSSDSHPRRRCRSTRACGSSGRMRGSRMSRTACSCRS